MKAAKKFNYSAFFTVIGIALGVGVFGVLVVNCAGERREHCYEVREYSSFEGSLQVREFNLWWGSDRREVRKFPDTESARRFAATKNLVMCR